MEVASQVAIWVGAISTALGGLLGGWATAYVMIRKANAEVRMGERKQEDGVAAEAYSLFKEAMNSRVTALEKALEAVTGKLEIARDAHAKCEVETEKVKGQLAVMQEKIDRLSKHDEATKKQIAKNIEEIEKVKDVL